MTKKERINEAFLYLKNKGIVHTQKDVAKAMGASASNVSSALSGVESVLTDKFMSRFNEAFGDMFNEEWLLSGEGEMLKGTDASIQKSINSCAPDIPTTVLLLPIYAQGGSLNDFVASVSEYDCERVVSPIGGVDFAMQVSGDSMSPEYPNGSRIFIKKINERAFIEWGKTYVLDTCNGTVIKRIVPSEREGYVRCISINPDPVYAPFEVSLSDVFGMYKVLLCMSVK